MLSSSIRHECVASDLPSAQQSTSSGSQYLQMLIAAQVTIRFGSDLEVEVKFVYPSSTERLNSCWPLYSIVD